MPLGHASCRHLRQQLAGLIAIRFGRARCYLTSQWAFDAIT